jgi:hypothetical protein
MDPIVLLGIAIVVALGAVIYVNRRTGADVNQDGKVDVADAVQAVENTVQAAKQTADINKDGKVDVADVKAAAGAVKTRAKKAVSTARKATSRKPAATKKTATKR